MNDSLAKTKARAKLCFGNDLEDGEQRIFLTPAYSIRHDPDDGKDYGNHSVSLNFGERRGDRAVSIEFFTDWSSTPAQQANISRIGDSSHRLWPMCTGLYYHSSTKLSDYERVGEADDCVFLPGICHGELGSALYGETIGERLIHEGSAGVWDEIDKAFKDKEPWGRK